MSKKRFECVFKEHETKNSWSMIKDNQLDKPLYIKDVVDLLNELANENEQLRQQLKEKEEDEKLYANEIVELRKTNEEWLQFKDLGGDY